MSQRPPRRPLRPDRRRLLRGSACAPLPGLPLPGVPLQGVPPLGAALLGALLLAACGADPAPASGPRRATRAVEPAPATPHWIWAAPTVDDERLLFRRAFELAAVPSAAALAGTCDNRMLVLVNGVEVGGHARWEETVGRDVAEFLRPGANTLEVRAGNEGGPGGLLLRLALAGGPTLVTDGSWRVAPDDGTDPGEGPDPAAWADATVLGALGAAGLPWSGTHGADALAAPGRMAPPESDAPQAPRAAEGLTLLPGFEAELLYTVPGSLQGSWVALACDPSGRLYASDERDRGLYRITPAPLDAAGAVTRVERVPVDLSGAQGLCWAFDSLYANVSGRGLFRLRDTDGDDRLDQAELLLELPDAGEHGPHAVVPTGDGRGLYVVGGNHTRPPAFDRTRAPSNWGEDLLLPRLWDPNGHARGRLAPGGWIARCDPDGANLELVSSGYRNTYDVAVAPDGELFTYDADMEWDLGLPWYRPTRICHATSGSEYGWRSGSGKWPVHYEDSLPPVLDIGPGSPTGLVFGTGLDFPPRHRRALYALDWTFGTLHAVHLEPRGSSYAATREEFLWGAPLALTDAAVGADGALYLTVGGRGTRSALYRVRHTGAPEGAGTRAAADDLGTADEGTADDDPADAGAAARAERRALEAFHGRVDPRAVDAAWPHLASPDRFLRSAARIAIENQPVATWRGRALAEPDPRARAVALVALARQGEPSDLGPLLDALDALDLAALDPAWTLVALRAQALALTRLGPPDAARRARLAATLEPLLPSGSRAVDTELVRLLVHLDAPSVVPRTLALLGADEPEPRPAWAALIERNATYGRPIARMLESMPPVGRIGLAFLLREATEGWTPALRRAYFEFIVEASAHPGGHSYAGFLERMRDDAAAHLDPEQERALADLLGRPLVAPPPDDVTPPLGPGRTWTLEAAVAAVEGGSGARDFAAGRNLYHAALCSSCHRLDGRGGAIGPDLTSVASKFSVPDLLEAIVEPSRVISDQYGSHTVVARDGRRASGLLVEEATRVTVYPRSPRAEPAVFARSEVASIEASSQSQMPAGLLDALNPDELRDLVAYLLSGGDPGSDRFDAPAERGSE